MLKIGIIVGSTRPGRKAAAVAKWVHDILKSRKDAEFEIVDIEDYKLPLLDEPVPPTMHIWTGSFPARMTLCGASIWKNDWTLVHRGSRRD